MLTGYTGVLLQTKPADPVKDRPASVFSRMTVQRAAAATCLAPVA